MGAPRRRSMQFSHSLTLVVAALSTVLFFVGREREILADEIEEDLEAVPAVVVPRLARRNTVVRVKE